MDTDTTFDQFPSEITEAVDGLAWLGHLEDTVSIWGHDFVLRTLKAGEELEASLLAKEYQDTFGQVKATAWAHVAAALVAVDGDENFCPPIGPNVRNNLGAKFRYITENWYWPVGEYLFGKYVDLNQRQLRALDALEDLSSRSRQNSWPTADSLKGQEDSQATSTASKSESSDISPEQMKALVQMAKQDDSATSS